MIMGKPQVGIIMGSDSDLELMQDAAKMLDEFGIEYQLTVVSAHRTPERMYKYAKSAAGNGIKVIIACAGGSAHLPGMVASMTTLPVIGIPRQLRTLNGLDSLLSISQMPTGIPVATVAIDGAKNAAILAARIIGTNDKAVQRRLEQYQKKMATEVERKASKLEKVGHREYLARKER